MSFLEIPRQNFIRTFQARTLDASVTTAAKTAAPVT